jgi:DNA-binding MurR/RpiR family transcriptional regulator
VAQHVLDQPRSALNDPIAQIARAADVSQPTVIRFCRSLGCEGLSDFKLRLASGLTGTIPITHTQVTGSDSMLELGAKVLGNTASAILQARDHLNRDSMDRAMRLIADSTRVEIYAVGHYGAVANDAQFKFLRVGVSAIAHTDTRLQTLAANLLTPDVVVVIISSSGRIPELLDVAEKAQERGASVIAITESQSPLARKSDLALIVDHVEDIATQVPMISRILHLLMIDILVVGVTLQRGTNVPKLGSEALWAWTKSRPVRLPPVPDARHPALAWRGHWRISHRAVPDCRHCRSAAVYSALRRGKSAPRREQVNAAARAEKTSADWSWKSERVSRSLALSSDFSASQVSRAA